MQMRPPVLSGQVALQRNSSLEVERRTLALGAMPKVLVIVGLKYKRLVQMQTTAVRKFKFFSNFGLRWPFPLGGTTLI